MTHWTNLRLEENITDFFQLDALLSAQYLDTFKRKVFLEPEKELMLAVLVDALACFQDFIFAQSGRRQSRFREAKEWIFLTKESEWLFSFENICEVLGLNPEYLRRGLLQWEEQRRAQSREPGSSSTHKKETCKGKRYRTAA
ncbi:MAG: hypothetical protein HY695_09865 [Deltaproteobacteria bacterium]|nr:hypothetical protein [Deltaproteobacteria bacterium]